MDKQFADEIVVAVRWAASQLDLAALGMDSLDLRQDAITAILMAEPTTSDQAATVLNDWYDRLRSQAREAAKLGFVPLPDNI